MKNPDLTFETAAWKAGYVRVAGVDEAGRGPWAGPLAAAAVILPESGSVQKILCGVRDSKQMSARQREEARTRICDYALTWCVGWSSVNEIDELGLALALDLAVQRAVMGLNPAPQYLYLDYMKLRSLKLPHTALKKGDGRCLSIAAASVLAKTARDEVMVALEAIHPGYGFAAHKGYGTADHRRALARLGVSPAHRKSFAPVKALLNPD